MSASNDGFYEVVWSRGQSQVPVSALAPRLGDLSGKRVAQLWDYVFRGDEIYACLEDGFRDRFPGITFVNWREFGNTHGENERAILEGLPGKLSALGVDAVISGIGA